MSRPIIETAVCSSCGRSFVTTGSKNKTRCRSCVETEKFNRRGAASVIRMETK